MEVKKLKDIEKTVCGKTEFRSEDVKMVVEEVFPAILDELLQGNDVMIKRFGRFTLLKKEPHVCVDARTGKKTMSNYKAIIKFKPSVMVGNQLAILTNPEYDWGDDEE